MPGSNPSLISESTYLRSSSSRIMVVLLTDSLGSLAMIGHTLHSKYILQHTLYVLLLARTPKLAAHGSELRPERLPKIAGI